MLLGIYVVCFVTGGINRNSLTWISIVNKAFVQSERNSMSHDQDEFAWQPWPILLDQTQHLVQSKTELRNNQM